MAKRGRPRKISVSSSPPLPKPTSYRVERLPPSADDPQGADCVWWLGPDGLVLRHPRTGEPLFTLYPVGWYDPAAMRRTYWDYEPDRASVGPLVSFPDPEPRSGLLAYVYARAYRPCVYSSWPALVKQVQRLSACNVPYIVELREYSGGPLGLFTEDHCRALKTSYLRPEQLSGALPFVRRYWDSRSMGDKLLHQSSIDLFDDTYLEAAGLHRYQAAN